MKTKLTLLFIVLILLNSISLKSQYYDLDSLYIVLEENNLHDTTIINTYNAISWQVKFQNIDTSKWYAEQALELSVKNNYIFGKAVAYRNLCVYNYLVGQFTEGLKNIETALKYSIEINNKFQIGKCYIMFGNLYETLHKPDSALLYSEKALEIFKELNNTAEIAGITNNISNLLSSLGNHTLALQYLFETLSIEEKLNNPDALARTYNSIGSAYDDLGNYLNSVKYFNKSIEYSQIAENLKWEAASLHNLGNVYQVTSNYDSAIIFYEKAFLSNQKINDSLWMSFNLSAISDIFIELNELDSALKYAYLAKDFLIKINYELASLELTFGDIYFLSNKLTEAEKYYTNGLRISRLDNELSYIQTFYNKLYKLEKIRNNYKKSLEYLELQIQFGDSILKMTDLQEIGRMEAAYNYEKIKQQQEFEQQQKDLQVAEQMKRQKITSIFLIIGFLLILIVAILMIFAYRTKRLSNIALQEKNEEILQQKDEIQQQNNTLQQQKEEILTINEDLAKKQEEIILQRDEIIKQHEIVSKKNRLIEDSINYAQKIQFAALPHKSEIDNILNDYFILFKPRDIVSGDFYWIKQIIRNNKNYKILVAADCTGHGVPGAFVSMLGISLLNELVRREEIKNSAQLLDELRVQIKASFKQTEAANSSQDGMDMSVCIIENNKYVQFAGANNPLYLIRNNELIVFKANKQPIGVHFREKPFTQQTFAIEENDEIFLFTDGYVDQFGGNPKRKFMTKNFKDLLKKIYSENTKTQNQILNDTFEQWKIGYNQLDDVLVIGVKF